MSQRLLTSLKRFSACDVSDALLKMGVSNGGFLPDILPRSLPKTNTQLPLVGRAWTVRFVEKSSPLKPDFQGHYIDQIPHAVSINGQEQSGWPVIAVLGAPKSLTCAVLGGIMALQASLRKAIAIVVSGRVRDLDEYNQPECMAAVYSRGLSTVGAGAGSKVVSIGTSCEVSDYGEVQTGDVVFIDANGVVVIPAHIDLEKLTNLMETLTSQDVKVKESVKAGMSVQDAFKKWRS